MALFSSNLKKMQNILSSSTVDWNKLASLSSGRYALSGKNIDEGKQLVKLIIKRASEPFNGDRHLTETFRNIISKGGDFNRSINSIGVTPLHLASGLEDSSLLKSLLQAGIQPVSTNASGSTPLHVAVTSGQIDNVNLLLAAGADPGAEDATSNAPLHFSVQLDEPVEIVTVLLAAGAKAYQRNAKHQTSVELAQTRGQIKAMELLQESLRHLRINSSKEWNCSQCHSPVKRPPRGKIEWYLSLDMWDHLKFTCGECGEVAFATELDGEC